MNENVLPSDKFFSKLHSTIAEAQGMFVTTFKVLIYSFGNALCWFILSGFMFMIIYFAFSLVGFNIVHDGSNMPAINWGP